jgi:hypothetical protein
MIAYVYGGRKPADIYRLYYHFKPLAWLQEWWSAKWRSFTTGGAPRKASP